MESKNSSNRITTIAYAIIAISCSWVQHKKVGVVS